MPRVSFIMPARNVEEYVGEAVESIRGQELRDWELLVIDDHSDDATAEIVDAARRDDPRIRLLRNESRGVVAALNMGFREAAGEFVKMVDSDDLLDPEFSRRFAQIASVPASYHDGLFFGAGFGRNAVFRVSPVFAEMGFEQSVRRLMISPPRWAFTMSREIAGRVFPLPAETAFPHEDIYIALLVKHAAGSVRHIPIPLYRYRQHSAQGYGGVHQLDRATVQKRARAARKVVGMIRTRFPEAVSERDFRALETYYDYMSGEPVGLVRLALAPLRGSDKAKAVLLRGFPRLSRFLSRARLWRPSRRLPAGASSQER